MKTSNIFFRKGDIVRTKKKHANGVYKAPVTDVILEDGSAFILVGSNKYDESELELVRRGNIDE